MDVRSLIAVLGGPVALAAALKPIAGHEVSAGTVYRWRDRNTISATWRPAVLRLANERGVQELPPELAQIEQVVRGTEVGGAQLPQPLKLLSASNASKSCFSKGDASATKTKRAQ